MSKIEAIVIENNIGPLIIVGSSDSTEVSWFMDKWVTADSPEEANELLYTIKTELSIVADTAFIQVRYPGSILSNQSLLSLEIPDSVPCTIRNVTGSCNVSNLNTGFTGLNLSSTTIGGHNGNCILSGVNGNCDIEIILKENGSCLIKTVSGNISLKIPGTTSSLLSAITGNGKINYSGLNLHDTVRTSSGLSGILGDGHGQIQLSTQSGNISIRGF